MSFSSAQTGTAPRAVLWADVRDSIRGVPRDYTTGRIGRAVVLLAIPMVLEMSMQSLFAVVDVFFVGRLGPEAVAILGSPTRCSPWSSRSPSGCVWGPRRWWRVGSVKARRTRRRR